MLILYITYVDINSAASGSSVRPQKMYKAFLDEGHKVKLLMGSQNRIDWPRRKKAIREVMEWLDTNTPDLCYIESPVYPIILPEDYRLIRKVHRMGVPIGYFYRDCQRRFPELFPRRSGLVGAVKERYLDWMQKRTDDMIRLVDIVYFPTKRVSELFDYDDMRTLPPGGENRITHSAPEKNTCIYVGGIVKTYGGTLLLDAFEQLNCGEETYHLILVCRKNEWAMLEHPSKNAPWLEVHHVSANELEPLYQRAGVAMAVYNGGAYADLAISVKLFEYLGYRLPIVVCGSKSMERMIEEGGFGRRAECTPESIAEEVKCVLAHRNTYAEKAEEALLRDGLWTHRVEQVVQELSEKKKKK